MLAQQPPGTPQPFSGLLMRCWALIVPLVLTLRRSAWGWAFVELGQGHTYRLIFARMRARRSAYSSPLISPRSSRPANSSRGFTANG